MIAATCTVRTAKDLIKLQIFIFNFSFTVRSLLFLPTCTDGGLVSCCSFQLKIEKTLFGFFTADGGVLFEVLSAYVDVFHQALASVSPPLLHRVLGTQSEHRHVFQRQTEAAQAPVELLGKTLSHLVALILQRMRRKKRRRQMEKWFRETRAGRVEVVLERK